MEAVDKINLYTYMYMKYRPNEVSWNHRDRLQIYIKINSNSLNFAYISIYLYCLAILYYCTL